MFCITSGIGYKIEAWGRFLRKIQLNQWQPNETTSWASWMEKDSLRFSGTLKMADHGIRRAIFSRQCQPGQVNWMRVEAQWDEPWVVCVVHYECQLSRNMSWVNCHLCKLQKATNMYTMNILPFYILLAVTDKLLEAPELWRNWKFTQR